MKGWQWGEWHVCQILTGRSYVFLCFKKNFILNPLTCGFPSCFLTHSGNGTVWAAVHNFLAPQESLIFILSPHHKLLNSTHASFNLKSQLETRQKSHWRVAATLTCKLVGGDTPRVPFDRKIPNRSRIKRWSGGVSKKSWFEIQIGCKLDSVWTGYSKQRNWQKQHFVWCDQGKEKLVMNLECTLNVRGQFEVECREGEKTYFLLKNYMPIKIWMPFRFFAPVSSYYRGVRVWIKAIALRGNLKMCSSCIEALRQRAKQHNEKIRHLPW